MDSRQTQLYQQVILEHNKKPRNYGELDGHTHCSEGYNPLCGDHLWVFLQVEGDVITGVSFKGEGCAISKASASMMTTALKGKSLDEARQLMQEFQNLIKGRLKPDEDEHHLGKLKIFSGIWQYPSRVKCAVLAWHAMVGALDQEETISTE